MICKCKNKHNNNSLENKNYIHQDIEKSKQEK